MSYEQYGITIPNSRTTGEVATTCPNCSKDRKKKSAKCLQVNLDKQVWNCKHCGWRGGFRVQEEKVVYTMPEWKNDTKLSDAVVKWFENRRISQQTLFKALISQSNTYMPQVEKEVNTINFNYFFNGTLKNVKYRDKDKNFKLHKGSELILYNLDCVKGAAEVWITEGEMDCLSFMEVGVPAVSVPNGANENLTYLDNYIHLFTGKIHIAVDNDLKGRQLREALADRFGRERCDFLEFGEHKDANDFLRYEGHEALKEQAYKFKEFPLVGVFTIKDMVQEIEDMYYNGLPSGVGTGMYEFDKHIRFEKGYITTITGIPSHGKSDWLDQMVLKLLIKEGWKGAFYSPENKPTRLHFSKLARKLVGQGWYGPEKMERELVMRAMAALDENIWFIKPENDFTLETILGHAKELQTRKGIDWFAIDAWNKLEHRYEVNETKYVGECLDKIAVFCERNNMHCFLVAHPTKMRKNQTGAGYEVPTLYDIAGSANFYNKTDNGITVFRDFDNGTTDIHILKVKFSHWGEPGMCTYQYEKHSGRYMDEHETTSSWI